MKFSFQTSSDLKNCKMHIDEPPKQNEVMTAADLETLISYVAEQRQRMIPLAHETEGITAGIEIDTDAISPKLDTALLQDGQNFVILAIAFPGLGWRNFAMTLPEAESLGRRLLAMSAPTQGSMQ